ncbi:MAG TPA: hypothetical protein VGL71_11855 [Urbifossiella sp.]
MRDLRSLGARVFLACAVMILAAATPSPADAVYYHRGYGAYQHPYYWQNGNANNMNQFHRYNNYMNRNPYYYGTTPRNNWRGYW